MSMITLNFADNQYVLAVGDNVYDIKSLKTSYKQAYNLINTYEYDKEKNIYFYDDMGVYKVLYEIRNNQVIKDYITDTIQNVYDYDQLNGTDYINTLRLYLKYNGAVNELSEKLFVHRNTINYRIKKIEKITNNNLSDFNTRLEFAIAIKLKDIFENNLNLINLHEK